MRTTTCLPFIAAFVALASVVDVRAERADRNKPVTIEADQPGTMDLLKQVVVFNGNVVITQGTMTIRAARVEVRQAPDGMRTATAIGSSGEPARFQQKRDGVDEYIEGQADRLVYDGRADTVHLVGNAHMRRLRAGSVSDEITGTEITYDNTAELFNVRGGGTSTASNPGGRVRAVLTPPPSPAASAAPPAIASQPGASLRPSTVLGDKK
ncbi:MAG TPA: lipopolysaccharide transport periplasmic protein LptA [Burkholderiaceae bacterium]|nr:lipopolysaccharide transport periplasmic protein LptA [Burkholderiaceae bacterium]